MRIAGERLLLLLIFSLQHNRTALQEAANAEGASNQSHTLAMLLLAADSNIGLRNQLVLDWSITRYAPCTVVHPVLRHNNAT